jgi:hypothetical protein
MTRKYRPTPFNIISVGLILLSIYAAIRPGPEGWGILGLFYLLPVGLVGLFIDYLLQGGKYWQTFAIESGMVVSIIFWYSWTQREKTLIIPDNIRDTYIVTVYGVDRFSTLPKGNLSWSYEINFPENGILLTSSSISEDLPETKIQTTSGIELNNLKDTSELCFGHVRTSSIKCFGKIYDYQAWKIDHGGIGSSSNELDSLEKRLTEYIGKKNKAQLVTPAFHKLGGSANKNNNATSKH